MGWALPDGGRIADTGALPRTGGVSMPPTWTALARPDEPEVADAQRTVGGAVGSGAMVTLGLALRDATGADERA